MWIYEEKCDPITNECIFGSLNSSDWWKNADAALKEDLNKLGNNKPKGSHYVCPIIGFDESTLCDNIGQLMVQPFLETSVMNHVALWTLGSYSGWYPPTQSPQRRERKIVTPNYNRSHTYDSTMIVSI